MNVELAKKVLSDNSKVLYGIFGVIESSGYFPPREFLNQFLDKGNDPCDQDGRMESWTPFILNAVEYDAVKVWWLSKYPGVVINDLGATSWDDWVVEIIEME